jgi:hypothetical protein
MSETVNLVLLAAIGIGVLILVVRSSKGRSNAASAGQRPGEGDRDVLDELPEQPSQLVDVECRDKLAVYQHQLEFHVLKDPEGSYRCRFKIPRSWLALPPAQLKAKLSAAINDVYVGFRGDFFESGDVNYPALVAARFRVRPESDPLADDDETKLHDLEAEG